jgi:class 3 adenylate cyclase
MVDIVRSFGQTTSRLAEWQLDTISRYLVRQEEASLEDGAQSDWERIARAQVVELLPELELLLSYVWRRQLTATLGRVFDEFDEREEDSDSATVGFADLVSFTRLSRQLDQDSLGKLVQTFETAASDVVHAAGGRLIKTLGDEVMFASDSASVAAEIGLRLHDISRAEGDMPQMRIGLGSGPVLMRMGDIFGTTVNRASRLTAAAKPGSTLMDGETAEAISGGQDKRFAVRAQAPRRIRGLGLMRPYALNRGVRWLAGSEGPATHSTVTDSGSDSGSSDSAGKT